MWHKSLVFYFVILSFQLSLEAQTSKKSVKKSTTSKTVIVADDSEAFAKMFKDYPWKLNQSRYAKQLVTEFGVEIDFNAKDLARYFAWVNERGFTAAEMKTNVENKIDVYLKKIITALRTNAHEGLGIKKITFLSDHDRMNIDANGTFSSSKIVFENPDRVSKFFRQFKLLKKYSDDHFDGILGASDSFDMPSSDPQDQYLFSNLDKFRNDIYPKIRNTLLKNRNMISKMIIVNHNDFSPPFQYSNTIMLIQFNITTMTDPNAPQDLESILNALTALPKDFLETIELSDFSIRNRMGNRFEYWPTVNGLEAIKEVSSEIQKNANIRFVRFDDCRPEYDSGRENDCDARIQNEVTLEIPVARKGLHGIQTHQPLGKNEIVDSIRKALQKN